MPLVHDHELLGPLGGEAEVVRDEQHGGAELAGEGLEVVEDRRCTVTSSAEVGSSAMSSFGSAARPMPMSTRWRMPPENWCGNCLQAVVGVGRPASFSTSMARLLDVLAPSRCRWPERLLDLEADAPHRVEVRHRVLRDEADLATADLLHLLLRRLREVPALEEDLAAGDLAGAGEQVDDRVRGRGLAGAGLADDREGLAAVEGEVDAATAGTTPFWVLKPTWRSLISSSGRSSRSTAVCCTFDSVEDLGHRRALAFGSSASRTTSPSMMKLSTVIDSAIEG